LSIVAAATTIVKRDSTDKELKYKPTSSIADSMTNLLTD